jgi:hypothetical protein
MMPLVVGKVEVSEYCNDIPAEVASRVITSCSRDSEKAASRRTEGNNAQELRVSIACFAIGTGIVGGRRIAHRKIPSYDEPPFRSI